MHGSGSGLLDPVWRYYSITNKRESRSASFGTKVVPCLWRANLSFMNSVTRCSKVLKYPTGYRWYAAEKSTWFNSSTETMRYFNCSSRTSAVPRSRNWHPASMGICSESSRSSSLTRWEFLITIGTSSKRQSWVTFRSLMLSALKSVDLYSWIDIGVRRYAFSDKNPLLVLAVSGKDNVGKLTTVHNNYVDRVKG